LNVRLANRLADWSIDVKTDDQFDEMDISAETKRAVSALFGGSEIEEEITSIAELPGISDRLVTLLAANDLTLIEDLVSLGDEELARLTGMEPADVEELSSIIAENVEIVESEEPLTGEPDSIDEYSDEESELEFDEENGEEDEEEGDEGEDVITDIADLPGMTAEIVEKLSAAGIKDLDALIQLDPEKIGSLEGMTAEEADAVRVILTENVEIVEQDNDETE